MPRSTAVRLSPDGNVPWRAEQVVGREAARGGDRLDERLVDLDVAREVGLAELGEARLGLARARSAGTVMSESSATSNGWTGAPVAGSTSSAKLSMTFWRKAP